MFRTLQTCRCYAAHRAARSASDISKRSLSWLSSHGSGITAPYLVSRPRVFPPSPRRPFSITRSLAEDGQPSNPVPNPQKLDPEFLKAFSETKLFRKLSSDPEAVNEMASFVKLLQTKGIDPTSGKPLGTMQLIRLVSDAEFREAAKRIQERFKKLDIDLKSPVRFDSPLQLPYGMPHLRMPPVSSRSFRCITMSEKKANMLLVTGNHGRAFGAEETLTWQGVVVKRQLRILRTLMCDLIYYGRTLGLPTS